MDMRQIYTQHLVEDYSLDLMFSYLALDVTEAINSHIKCDDYHSSAVFTFEANVVDTVISTAE